VEETESNTACTSHIHFEFEFLCCSNDSSHNNVAFDDELDERRSEFVTTWYFSSSPETGWYFGGDILSERTETMNNVEIQTIDQKNLFKKLEAGKKRQNAVTDSNP
jgi:hypothetical protein